MNTSSNRLTASLCTVFVALAALACGKVEQKPQWPNSKKLAGKQQGLSHVSNIVVDDKFAYVTIGGTVADANAGTNGLRKIDLATGAVTSLDDGKQSPQAAHGGIGIDEKYVYWKAGSTIQRIAKEGGTSETIVSENVGMGIDLAVDNERVYWTNHGYYSANTPQVSSPIYSALKSGGKAETFVADQMVPHDVAVDDKFVYWCTPTSVLRRSKTGGDVFVIFQANDKEGVDNLAVYRGDVHFGFRAADSSRWALRKLATSSTEPQMIKTIASKYSLKPIAFDGDNLYFFDEDGLNSDVLCRTTINGGNVEKLDSGYSGGTIAVGKSGVYFGTLDDVMVIGK